MVCESDDVSTILISIKPEFVVSIMDGKKKYEFRKMACKKSVDKIVIYSTSPVSKVVGEADVETVLIDTPDKIWQETKEQAGINQQFFINIMRVVLKPWHINYQMFKRIVALNY